MAWQFLLVQGASTPAAIDASLQDAKSHSFTVRLDDAGSASFNIDGTSVEAMQIGELSSDILVMHFDEPLFRGRVGTTTDSIGPEGHRTQVEAWDYRELLNRRFIHDGDTTVYAEQEQEAIAWALINNTQQRPAGDLGISRIGFSTGTTRAHEVRPGDSVGKTIEDLAKMENGFEWEISPRLEFRAWAQRGVDPAVMSLEVGGNVRTMRRTLSPGEYANVVRLTGAEANIELPGPSLYNVEAAGSGFLDTWSAYNYAVTAVYPWGETKIGNTRAVTTENPGQENVSIFLDWYPRTGATSYNIYGRNPGVYKLIGNSTISSWQDSGASSPGVNPPSQALLVPQPVTVEDPEIVSSVTGRFEHYQGFPESTYPPELQARAEGMLSEKNRLTATYQLELAPEVWRNKSDLWLGDKVHLFVQSGRLQVAESDLRVIEMQFDIDEDDQETVTVTLGRALPNVFKELRKTYSRLQRLERR